MKVISVTTHTYVGGNITQGIHGFSWLYRAGRQKARTRALLEETGGGGALNLRECMGVKLSIDSCHVKESESTGFGFNLLIYLLQNVRTRLLSTRLLLLDLKIYSSSSPTGDDGRCTETINY